MGLYDKVVDEIWEGLISCTKVKIDEKRMSKKFSVIWDGVRDEYESLYNRDILYRRMWLEDKMIEKQMLSFLKQKPVSREFIVGLFSFAKRIMREDFDETACKNFVGILLQQLLYWDEMSDKIIKVRQDYELGLQTEMAKRSLSTIEKEKKELLEEREKKENVPISIDETVIDLFADNYTRIMFMQKSNEAQISLKDIYVENDYTFILGENESVGLISFVYQFCSEMNKTPILFIEGHAGIGKSSLVSRMAYDFRNNRSIWKDKKLAVIQLRNLVKDSRDLDVNNPWADFKRYLKFNGSMKRLMETLDEYVLVLDGFDELCLIDNIRLRQKLTYISNILNVLEDYQCGCKIIVTTRPNYLARRDEWKIIYQNPIVISLEHFSPKKREEWMEKAKKAGLRIPIKMQKVLSSALRKDVEVVASTPFTLYLIAHENIEISQNDALWTIYMKIFGEEVIRKRYDRLNENDEVNNHPGTIISKKIYILTKEIAYYMFANNKMDIDWDEIGVCIERVVESEMVDDKDRIRMLLKDSYALFSYYKETELSGGISFYHNYIREFFVQEKIHEILKEIYLVGMKEKEGDSQTAYIKNMLCELLSMGKLSDKTIDFLCSYETVNKNEKTWSKLESRLCFMKNIFTDILVDMSNEHYDENIIINMWILLHIVHEIYSENKDNEQVYYEMFDEKKLSGSNGKNNIESYLELISRVTDIKDIDLQKINLRGKILRNIVFDNCNLRGAKLPGTNIENVIFIDCDLRDIDVRGAVLNNVSFKQCKMERGKIMGAYMNYSQFVSCSMSQCQLSGTKIVKTIFEETNIENAILNATEFVQVEIKEARRILENISAFEHADVRDLKWNEVLDKELFYGKLDKLKQNKVKR